MKKEIFEIAMLSHNKNNFVHIYRNEIKNIYWMCIFETFTNTDKVFCINDKVERTLGLIVGRFCSFGVPQVAPAIAKQTLH